MDDAPITLLAMKPELVFPWADGLELLDSFVEGKAEWDECVLCTGLNILLGCGGMPLMVGLLVAGKLRMYKQCLVGLRFAVDADRIKELDKFYRSLVEDYTSAKMKQ
jgi:hypothetical protein